MEGKTPDKEFEQKSIRTYEGDIADAIEHQKTSQVSMAIAQNKREVESHQQQNGVSGIMVAETNQKPPSSLGKNILKIFISLILIAAGIFGGYYLYSISPLAIKNPVSQQTTQTLIPSIITADIQKTFNVQGISTAQMISEFQNQSISALNNGGILEIIPYMANTKITPAQFMTSVGLTPPDMLTRSLTNSWMVGIHDTGGNREPFIILTTNFFQNAFSGMLQWEPSMADDFSKLFNLNSGGPVIPQLQTAVASSSTASTSPISSSSGATTSQSSGPPPSFFNIRGTFNDKVIQNKDVREFESQNGQTLFLYAFIDSNTLVIARDEATLGDIITRFEKRSYVR